MRRQIAASFVVLLAACRNDGGRAFLEAQRALVRPGVELSTEEREVRRVLRQRKLEVVDELRGSGFVALGAETADERLSAVRVITGRGVVLAEDAAADDLFDPANVALLSELGTRFDDEVLIPVLRAHAGADAGCVTLHRLMPDQTLLPVVLDVSAFGSRACVAGIAHGIPGHMRVTIAWPGLATIRTPVLESELAFAPTLVGRAAPRVLVARVVHDGEWLEAARVQLEAQLPGDAPFSERHAIGVARAALALATGKSRDDQLGAYRSTVGRVLPGSYEAEVAAETQAHIERGWIDEAPAPPEAPVDETPIPPDAEVIEPVAPPPELTEPEDDGTQAPSPDEAEVIEPEP